MEKEILEAIKEYKQSQEFADDCSSIRSSSIIKWGYLMDDYEVEQTAEQEKTYELLIKKECRVKGHVFHDEVEVIDNQAWICCDRCGEWFERGKKV